VAALGTAPQSVNGPGAVQGQDDGVLEVGVEYINDFHGVAPNLGLTDDDALSLYSRLGNCGWTRRFAYGNDSAWETDWKGADKPGGHGQENTYADSVDLAYISTHGGPDSVLFGSTHDDHYLNTADCRLNWGDRDAEWVGLSSCLAMQTDASRRNWAWCMNGLHLIMGFETTMADVNHGDWFGYYLCNGYNVTQAWFRAADALQPQGKVAGIIAEELVDFNDRPGVSVAGDTWDMDYYYWRHPVGSEPARLVDVNALNGVMPVFKTKQLGAAEADSMWGNLGNSFGVSTTTPSGKMLFAARTEADPIRLSLDKQLEMDLATGLYAFTNLQTLWTTPTVATKSPAYLLTTQDAITVANQFLTTNGLMPRDAQYYEVASDVVSTQAYTPSLGMTRGDAEVVASQPANYEVIYSRILTYTPPIKAGTVKAPEAVEFSVIGPGAKLKVFVDPNAAALSSMKGAASSAVIGGVGGWRQLASSLTSQPSAVETVPILTYNQISKLFASLEPIVALSYVPLPYASRTVTTYTLGYYEGAIGESQAELIPTYVLNVSYTLAGGEVITTPAYIPANETYMAPLALITPTTQLPASVRIGQQVVFTAADATATLSSLGYDASLNFVLGSGADAGPYVYNWCLDTSDNCTGANMGRVFTYTASLAGLDAGRTTQNIVLKVTDQGASGGNNVSVTNYQLKVVPPVYLPLMPRD
jgi:hypothetical protein